MYRALAGLSVLLSVVTLPSLSQGHTRYLQRLLQRTLDCVSPADARTNVLSHDRNQGSRPSPSQPLARAARPSKRLRETF